MKRVIILLLVLFVNFMAIQVDAQDTLRLSLREAIRMAQEHSPEAIAGRHAFRASYWKWRSFKANLLPSLTFTSNPFLNRSISAVTNSDGTDNFVHRNQLLVDAGLTLNQNLPFTGGSLFVNTSLQRLDMFDESITSYKSTPIVIGYEQNIFGYNTLKWDKKIEPVRYIESKKALVETLELIAARTTLKFFQLASAQTNWEIACYNHTNAETLFQFAEGRYNIGTITENEMLQLEINLLTEQMNMMNANIEMDDYAQELRSYLGLNENISLIVDIEENVSDFVVPVDRALLSAYENNPQPEQLKRRKIESESAVAQAKAQRGFRADLYIQFGLTQSDQALKEAYRSPMDQQLVSLGIRIPILDWGVGKGKVKVAISDRDRVFTEVEQARTDFELNVIKLVKQFNLQADKVTIAKKTDQTARRRNEVAHKLYLLGKSDILDLNASIAEKGRSRRAYISALYNYWNLYYGVRSLTGYDFEKNIKLTYSVTE